MRCQCCNRNLSNYESVLRHPETAEYLDTCNRCLSEINNPIELIKPIAPADMEIDSYDDEDFLEEIEDDE